MRCLRLFCFNLKIPYSDDFPLDDETKSVSKVKTDKLKFFKNCQLGQHFLLLDKPRCLFLLHNQCSIHIITKSPFDMLLHNWSIKSKTDGQKYCTFHVHFNETISMNWKCKMFMLMSCTFLSVHAKASVFCGHISGLQC